MKKLLGILLLAGGGWWVWTWWSNRGKATGSGVTYGNITGANFSLVANADAIKAWRIRDDVGNYINSSLGNVSDSTTYAGRILQTLRNALPAGTMVKAEGGHVFNPPILGASFAQPFHSGNPPITFDSVINSSAWDLVEAPVAAIFLPWPPNLDTTGSYTFTAK